MPDSRQILILSLSRRVQGAAREQPTRRLRLLRPRLYLPPLYLPLLIRLLRLLGFKFSTVSQALKSPTGKFACLTFDSPDASITNTIAPQLSHGQVPATVFVTTAPHDGQPEWHELKLLKAQGWEIGTLGHELVNLTDKSHSEQQQLIAQAKLGFSTHLGLGSRLFAYPFGAYDATTVSCLREAGFSAALTLRAGVNSGDVELQRFHLRRLPLLGSLLRDLPTILKVCFSASRQGKSATIGAPRRDGVQSTGAAT